MEDTEDTPMWDTLLMLLLSLLAVLLLLLLVCRRMRCNVPLETLGATGIAEESNASSTTSTTDEPVLVSGSGSTEYHIRHDTLYSPHGGSLGLYPVRHRQVTTVKYTEQTIKYHHGSGQGDAGEEVISEDAEAERKAISHSAEMAQAGSPTRRKRKKPHHKGKKDKDSSSQMTELQEDLHSKSAGREPRPGEEQKTNEEVMLSAHTAPPDMADNGLGTRSKKAQRKVALTNKGTGHCQGIKPEEVAPQSEDAESDISCRSNELDGASSGPTEGACNKVTHVKVIREYNVPPYPADTAAATSSNSCSDKDERTRSRSQQKKTKSKQVAQDAADCHTDDSRVGSGDMDVNHGCGSDDSVVASVSGGEACGIQVPNPDKKVQLSCAQEHFDTCDQGLSEERSDPSSEGPVQEETSSSHESDQQVTAGWGRDACP